MKGFKGIVLLALMAAGSLLSSRAQAVPAFARQTGMDCTTCHMSWLELTNVGRRFKLGGYQLMKQFDDAAKRPLVTLRFDTPPPLIPLAFATQLAVTHTAKTNTPGTVTANNSNTPGGAGTDFQSQNEVVLQAASVFLNGKIAEHLGCFCQFTYDGAAGTTTIDNFELRAANTYSKGWFEAIYGLSFNNNPGMSDVYNTTPVWSWPYISSEVAVQPIATPISNASLAQSAAGLTAYALLGKTLYIEGGVYHTTNGALAFMHLNIPQGSRYILDGLAPYYRLALQHDWSHGHQSIELGVFGLQPKVYQPQGITIQENGPSDKYLDRGFDAQYQYIYDKHRFSWMATLIDEKQHYQFGPFGAAAANSRDTLSFINTKVSYYYQKWYGASVGLQRTSGSPDSGLYLPAFNAVPPAYPLGAPTASAVLGSLNGSPDTRAVIGELDYLFAWDGAQDHRKNRIVLQYTAYNQFNGGNNNYNGNGRNARDNNFLWLGVWSLY